jgi:hypothetical protein
MKSRQLSRLLRWSALLVVVLGLTTWFASGARVGWTQTSAVSMARDEITGIEYPVRRDVFLPGVELPLGAIGLAALLGGLSRLARPRSVQS